MPAGIFQSWMQFGSHCWNELNQTEHVAIACVQTYRVLRVLYTVQASTEFRLGRRVMSGQPFLDSLTTYDVVQSLVGYVLSHALFL